MTLLPQSKWDGNTVNRDGLRKMTETHIAVLMRLFGPTIQSRMKEELARRVELKTRAIDCTEQT